MPDPDLRQRLLAATTQGTPGERVLAQHVLAHLADLPFETAASLARRVGVSEASVGRFCRALGYRHLKDMKADLQAGLGDAAWLIGDRLAEFHARSQSGKTELSQALDREIMALASVYEIAASPAFDTAVQRLAHSPRVWVAGFQTERGHAAELAHNLHYLRPDVHLADVAGGHFAGILLDDPGQAALVLIDGRRYSRLTRELAQAARAAGVPVTLITDPYCDWAAEAATEVFAVPTALNHFWDKTSAMSSLIGLMVNGVFRALGPKVEPRMARISALYGQFIGHSSPARPRGGQG